AGPRGLEGGLRPADRHGEAHRGAGQAGARRGPGAGRRGEGAATGRAVRGDLAAAEARDPAGRAPGPQGRPGPGLGEGAVAVRAAHAGGPPVQGRQGGGVRPEDPPGRGGGRDHRRVRGRGAGRRPGPAVSGRGAGEPRGPVRPRAAIAGRRPRDGVGGERAAGEGGGGQGGGAAARRQGAAGAAGGREGEAIQGGLSVPCRDRGSDPRAAARLSVEAMPVPRGGGDGSVGRLGDPGAQPLDGRGSGGGQVGWVARGRGSSDPTEMAGPTRGDDAAGGRNFAPQTSTTPLRSPTCYLIVAYGSNRNARCSRLHPSIPTEPWKTKASVNGEHPCMQMHGRNSTE